MYNNAHLVLEQYISDELSVGISGPGKVLNGSVANLSVGADTTTRDTHDEQYCRDQNICCHHHCGSLDHHNNRRNRLEIRT